MLPGGVDVPVPFEQFTHPNGVIASHGNDLLGHEAEGCRAAVAAIAGGFTGTGNLAPAKLAPNRRALTSSEDLQRGTVSIRANSYGTQATRRRIQRRSAATEVARSSVHDTDRVSALTDSLSARLREHPILLRSRQRLEIRRRRRELTRLILRHLTLNRQRRTPTLRMPQKRFPIRRITGQNRAPRARTRRHHSHVPRVPLRHSQTHVRRTAQILNHRPHKRRQKTRSRRERILPWNATTDLPLRLHDRVIHLRANLTPRQRDTTKRFRHQACRRRTRRNTLQIARRLTRGHNLSRRDHGHHCGRYAIPITVKRINIHRPEQAHRTAHGSIF